MIVYLIGLPGVGKTTIGKLLAQKVGYDFLDLDDVIVQKLGRSITNVFKAEGENYFREKEREALHETFSLNDTIISCGGGTPCFFDNITEMNTYGKTIYLFNSLEKIINRLTASDIEKRPLFKEGVQQINNLYDKRRSFYEKASLTVNVEDHNSLDTIKDYILTF